MKKKNKIEIIVKPLLEWYERNARELPWREEKEPYHIWISEIMLQQTRIEAVREYYQRFVKALPNIASLAKIEEEKLLKLWEGLGYYNRARNLKRAAKKMMEDYQGKMPETYEELIQLPGIGEYTAGAIASIAYDQKVPAVDGNVLRVISRIEGSKKDIMLAKTKKEVSEKLLEIMPEEAGKFNEALMELGETICVPNGEPLCMKCPLNSYCEAYQKGLTNQIPVRIKKVKRKVEEKTVLLLIKDKRIAILKRQESGLLAGMYEFPNLEGKLEVKQVEEVLKQWNSKASKIEYAQEYRHIFSHKEWDMIAYKVEVDKEIKNFLWVTKESLKQKYPMPGAFLNFQNNIEN